MFNYEWIYHIEKEKKMLTKLTKAKEDAINSNNAIKKLGLHYQYDADKLMRTIEGNLKIQ